MSDLIDTTEMYLRTIYELVEDGVTPMRARIAEQLGHSGPTVSQTIARMERDGLVVVTEDRHLELTPQGATIATRVMRKHRLAERLLTDVIGLELPYVHDEACRWEHVMSERVERRLMDMLDGPSVSPYGNPIPGLEELRAGAAIQAPDAASPHPRDTPLEVPAGPLAGETSAWDSAQNGVMYVMVVRLGEKVQALPGFLELAASIGVVPGTMVTLERDDDRVILSTEAGSMTIPGDDARHVFVDGEFAIS